MQKRKRRHTKLSNSNVCKVHFNFVNFGARENYSSSYPSIGGSGSITEWRLKVAIKLREWAMKKLW